MKDRNGKYLLPLDYVVAWDGFRHWFGWITKSEDWRAKIRVDGCSFATVALVDPKYVVRLPGDPFARQEIFDKMVFESYMPCLT